MLYPLIGRKSCLSRDNKIILAKGIFQFTILDVYPVWSVCAKSNIKNFQFYQNKLLKMMLNLPWQFSIKDLHKKKKNNIKLLIKINFFNRALQSFL